MMSSVQHSRSRLMPVVIVAIVALFAPNVADAQRAASTAGGAPAIAAAAPESVGMSAARLARLTAAFKKEIDDKKVPGAVMLIARKGELTQNAAVKDALAQAGLFKPGVIDFDVRDMTGAEQVERLARIPLLYQPGTTWEYSLASDVLGRVVEAASRTRLGDFLSERVYKPLRMTDTAFWVAAAKLGRVAEPFDKDPIAGTAIKLIDVAKQPENDSGGAGGLATAGDYLRFAQMLANGGVLDGQRVLSRTTVKLMTAG